MVFFKERPFSAGITYGAYPAAKPFLEALKDRIINITSRENEDLRKELESRIASLEALSCEKEYVIVNSLTVKSVREMHRDSEGGIIVIDRNGNEKRFEDESTVFSSIDESMKDIPLMWN